MSVNKYLQAAQAMSDGPADTSGAIWADFAREVDAVYQQARNGCEISVQHALRQATQTMYNQLVDDEMFRLAFRSCPEPHLLKVPTWSTTLFGNQHLHVELMSVYRDRGVPLHDHPDSYGVTLVLSGIARINYADVIERDESTNLVKLQMDRTRERLPGQVCWFFEDERNLHSIEATTAMAQLLVIHLPPVVREKQAFYFPVDDKPCSEGEVVMARRVNIKRNV